MLVCQNNIGYRNLNTLQFEGEKQKYYNPIIDFDLLEKYHEGLICTSACVAGYLAKCIIADKTKQAEKFIEKMIDIFGDDFYIEVQPYAVSDEGMQEKVNVDSIRLAKKYGVSCILTSDSHYGSTDDFDTYMKMHEIAKHQSEWAEGTYGERYMPTEEELWKRFSQTILKNYHIHGLWEEKLVKRLCKKQLKI